MNYTASIAFETKGQAERVPSSVVAYAER